MPHFSAFNNSEAPPPPPQASANDNSPRVITDLSQIFSSPSAAPYKSWARKGVQPVEEARAPQAEVTHYNIDRFYLASEPIQLDAIGSSLVAISRC